MKRIIIITCLLLANYVSCFAHIVKIGRFEVLGSIRMSIYAYGASATQWDYIYVDSPWGTPFCIERRNIDAFISYTIEAADKYKQWTEEIERIGNVSEYHKHIDFYPNVFVLYNINHNKYGIEKKHIEADSKKLSYDFVVHGVGRELIECRVQTYYEELSFYLDPVGMDDFIYVLQHATERYMNDPNIKANSALDRLLK